MSPHDLQLGVASNVDSEPPDATRRVNRPIFRAAKYILCAAVMFLIVVGLQWRNGAFESGFGSHPDEAGHYVTGLMVYKYVTTSPGTNPMAFAERFYAHYPAVAFGHWPPLFYVLQATWGLFFGLSRTSDLLLLAVLAVLVMATIYYSVRSSLGWTYAIACAAVFPILPIVQQHSSSIMAELPLTLFTFATALAFARLHSKPTSAAAFLFGLFLCSAILVKGNGWALIGLPIIALLTTKSLSLLRSKYIWIPLLSVFACCGPFVWLTMRMTKDGWAQQSPSFAFFSESLPRLFGLHVSVIGFPLFALACGGFLTTIVRPLWTGNAVRSIWASNLAVVASVLFFHAAVPTSVEPRKLFMSIPSLLLFAAAGLRYATEALPKSLQSFKLELFVMGAIASYYLLHTNVILHANMSTIANDIVNRSDLDRSVILVASNEKDERAELSFVAEVAERDKGSYRHAVIRGGKFVADSSWLGLDYKLRYSDVIETQAALRKIPISAVTLYAREGPSNAHEPLIGRLVAMNSGWFRVQSRNAGVGTAELWKSRMAMPEPVQLPEMDLVRKLGRNISAAF